MITLYTAGTPNGRKISIMLEELGIDYKVHECLEKNDEDTHRRHVWTCREC